METSVDEPHSLRFIERVGLAIATPRWALVVADESSHSGRSGSDLLRLLGLSLLAVHLRRLVAAGWLTMAFGPGAGLRGLAAVLSQAFNVDLAFLVIATVLVWALGGAHRAIGRAFDLVCVAVVPLIIVELVGSIVGGTMTIAGLGDMPMLLSWTFAGLAFGWAGVLLAYAARLNRRRKTKQLPFPPSMVVRRARRVGILVVIALAGSAALNIAWVVNNRDLLRPVMSGDVAPAISLPTIGAAGALGPNATLTDHAGKVVIVDFWATWCQPCLEGLPALDAIARRGAASGLVVLALNIDNPKEARRIFDSAGYQMTLVAGDRATEDRYGVQMIPHTVVIDRRGRVRDVHRGGGVDWWTIVSPLLAESAK